MKFYLTSDLIIFGLLILFSVILIIGFYWLKIRKRTFVYLYGDNKIAKIKSAKYLTENVLAFGSPRQKRFAIITTNPIIDNKNREWYFVYYGDIHTHNPFNGKIIDEDKKENFTNLIKRRIDEMNEEEKEYLVKLGLLEKIETKNADKIDRKYLIKSNDINYTYKLKIEDLSNHEFTEVANSYLIDNTVISDIIKSSWRIDKFLVLILIMVGLGFGIVLGFMIYHYMIAKNITTVSSCVVKII